MSTTPRTDEVYDRRLAPEKPGITGHELSKQLETELAAERKKVRVLRSALERRHDEQSYYCQYVEDALAATKEDSR